jgi:hypothetical protein
MDKLSAGRMVARTVRGIDLVVLVLCWACPRAHAQESQPDGGSPETGAPPASGLALPTPAAPPVDPPASLDWRRRSPSVALGLAIITPASLLGVGGALMLTSGRRGDSMWWGGLALVALGVTVGPSSGHIYSGSYGHAAGMSALRALAAAAGSVVLLATLAKGDCEDGPAGSCDISPAALIFAFGLLTVIPATGLYDMIDAPRAARRANADHGLAGLTLVPLFAPNGVFAQRGLAVASRF